MYTRVCWKIPTDRGRTEELSGDWRVILKRISQKERERKEVDWFNEVLDRKKWLFLAKKLLNILVA